MSEQDEAHAAWVKFTRVAEAMAVMMTSGKPAVPSERCMGRRCSTRAEYEVRMIDAQLAANEHPIRLCRQCLVMLDSSGFPVDIFRWLSDNRIEADWRG